MLTPEEQELLRRHISIDGDGNVVGDDNTVQVTKQSAGDYAVQIGEQYFTFHITDLRRVLNFKQSQVGIAGSNATVHGDIHQHKHEHHHYSVSQSVLPSDGRCDYYRQISRPPHYIPRRKVLNAVRTALKSANQQTPEALHGMGGIGKTVVARALCEDPEVQETFSDGILWTTLGQEVTDADLRTKLREWIDALGGVVSETAPTVVRLKVILAQLLADRACLLIVDDVWRRTHAEVFQIGGSRCRLLFTTRDAEIARGLGARLHPVDVLESEQAVALLEQWADGKLSDEDEELKEQIVKRVGYLPLAVKLAGEQLRRHDPEKWLARFDARRLRSSRPESIHDDLYLTFSLSLEDLDEKARRCYLTLAIFSKDEPIPLAALSRLWGTLAGLDDLESRDLMHDLAARALAQLEETDQGLALTLHDLLRDFIGVELGQEGILNAHHILMDAYRGTQEGNGWHTAPDDGYLYDHLSYHLDAIADGDEEAAIELHGLFATDAWLHVRVLAEEYRYEGYLIDLVRAWRRVYAQATIEIMAGQPAPVIAANVHYALIHTKVNTLATSYVPELVARAVVTGLWSPARGLSVLQRVADTRKQTELARALLATGQLTEEQSAVARNIGLVAAGAIQDTRAQAEALVALIPYFQGNAQQQVLDEALVAARAMQYKRGRIEVLMALALQLEGDNRQQVLTEALSDVRALEDTEDRVTALATLVPHLEGEAQQGGLAESLAAVRTTDKAPWRVHVLAALAPHLQRETRQQMLTEVLSDLIVLENERDRATALAVLAPHLEGEAQQWGLAESLANVQAIEEASWQVRTLKALASHLQPPLLDEALGISRALQHGWYKVEALMAIVPYLKPDAQEQVVAEAFSAAHNIQNKWVRDKALAILAPYLQYPLLKEVMALPYTLQDEWQRVKILISLVAYLQEDTQQRVLDEVFAATLTFQDKRERVATLVALASYLQEDTRQQALNEALAAALALQDKRVQVEALVALAPHLQEDIRQQVLNKALTIVLTLRRQWGAVEALMALVPHLQEDTRQHALTEALAAAHAITNRVRKVEALAAVARHLQGENQQQVLDAALVTARIIRYAGDRAAAIAALVPHLGGCLPTEVLADVHAIKQEERKVEILVSLAPYLKGASMIDALATTRALQDKRGRVKVFEALVPHLEGELQQQILGEILADVRVLQDEEWQVYVLAALAPHLQSSLLHETLAITYAFPETGWQVWVLTALAPRLEGKRLEDARVVLIQYLWSLQDHRHETLFGLLARNEAAFLRAFDLPPEAYAEIAQSIIDICTQWEWL